MASAVGLWCGAVNVFGTDAGFDQLIGDVHAMGNVNREGNCSPLLWVT